MATTEHRLRTSRIPTLARNCLLRVEYRTLEDVAANPDGEARLRLIPNLGDGGIAEIRWALNAVGLTLAGDIAR